MNLANVLATLKLAADRAEVQFFLYSETPRVKPECSYPTHQHLTSEGLDIEVIFIDPKAPKGTTMNGAISVPTEVLDANGIDKVRESFVTQIATRLCPDVREW
jgi:hypothetical protein